MQYVDPNDGTMVTLWIQATETGQIELVRQSENGFTVHFDSPADALKRWNAWRLATGVNRKERSVRGETAFVWDAHNGDDGIAPFRQTTGSDLDVPARGQMSVLPLAEAIGHPVHHGHERRGGARVPAQEVCWLRGARLRYGRDLRVIDISSGGIQIESDRAYDPGETLVIDLFGTFVRVSVIGKVVRCYQVAYQEMAWYHIACRLKQPARWGLIPPSNDVSIAPPR